MLSTEHEYRKNQKKTADREITHSPNGQFDQVTHDAAIREQDLGRELVDTVEMLMHMIEGFYDNDR